MDACCLWAVLCRVSYVLQYRSERCCRVSGMFCSSVVRREVGCLVCSAVQLWTVWKSACYDLRYSRELCSSVSGMFCSTFVSGKLVCVVRNFIVKILFSLMSDNVLTSPSKFACLNIKGLSCRTLRWNCKLFFTVFSHAFSSFKCWRTDKFQTIRSISVRMK